MKTEMTLFLLLFVLPFTGCSQFNSAKGKSTAQTLSSGRWIVEGPDRGASSSDCGDCHADIVLWLKAFDSKKEQSVCIDSTNAQFADFAKLKGGDEVSFEVANNPVQQKCGGGAFIILKK